MSSEESTNISYYVICGLLIPDSKIEEATEMAATIVQKHAPGGELKSSQIGNNTGRREKILFDVAKYNFSPYCLVINKSRIWKDSGLRWKPSSYKFLHKLFYGRLKKAHIGIQVLADQYGRSEFMLSFQEYIKNESSLFDTFNFSPSPEVPLLQIADVVAGSVRRVFENLEAETMLEILGYPSIPIEEWPPLSERAPLRDTLPSTDYDRTILSLALSKSLEFVEQYLCSDDERDLILAEAIRYLLFRFNTNPTEYVYRAEIIRHIADSTGNIISETYLSTYVLAVARDYGVLIASTGTGVKIPSGVSDLQDWIDRTNSQVVPYLKRIESARNAILMASHNQHDIVASASYPDLAQYIKR